MKKIIHNRAQCRRCGDTIESEFRHDYKTCSCGTIFVDGGKDYLRRGAEDPNDLIELSEVVDVASTTQDNGVGSA